MTEASTETKAETTGGASAATRTYEGGCHCGMVRFAVTTALGPVLACNCSICSRKGSLMWFVPREKLRLQSADDAAATYEFNKHVIKHRFCPTCGIHPYGEGTDPKGNRMAAVNLRCIEGLDLAASVRRQDADVVGAIRAAFRVSW